MSGPKPGREARYDNPSGKRRREQNGKNGESEEKVVPIEAAREVQDNPPPKAEEVRSLVPPPSVVNGDIEASERQVQPESPVAVETSPLAPPPGPRPSSIRNLITGELEKGTNPKEIERLLILYFPNSAAARKAPKHIAFYRSKMKQEQKQREVQKAVQPQAEDVASSGEEESASVKVRVSAPEGVDVHLIREQESGTLESEQGEGQS